MFQARIVNVKLDLRVRNIFGIYSIIYPKFPDITTLRTSNIIHFPLYAFEYSRHETLSVLSDYPRVDNEILLRVKIF